MAGYAASCRIQTVAPRAVRRSRAPAPAPMIGGDAIDLPVEDLIGRPLDEIIADRWASISESWSQTTFFLFDPESWR
ncbi:MAG: hypothetical protein WEC14_05410 [Chloroflexota bacterium]